MIARSFLLIQYLAASFLTHSLCPSLIHLLYLPVPWEYDAVSQMAHLAVAEKAQSGRSASFCQHVQCKYLLSSVARAPIISNGEFPPRLQRLFVRGEMTCE